MRKKKGGERKWKKKTKKIQRRGEEDPKKGKIWEAMGEDSASTTIDSSSIGFKLLKKHG